VSLAPLILLPPSEGKSPGGLQRRGRDDFETDLGAARERLRAVLGAVMKERTPEELAKLFGVRGDFFDRAVKANMAAVAEEGPWLPAWRRFNGVVWQYLEPQRLTPSERGRILIPNALTGLTWGTDSVADFRLTMKVSLPGVGVLSRWWQPAVTPVLSRLARRRVIVDFLPAEHAQSVAYQDLDPERIIRVRFVSLDGSRAVGHDAKAVKGALAHHVVRHGITDIASFRFAHFSVERTAHEVVVRAGER